MCAGLTGFLRHPSWTLPPTTPTARGHLANDQGPASATIHSVLAVGKAEMKIQVFLFFATKETIYLEYALPVQIREL